MMQVPGSRVGCCSMVNWSFCWCTFYAVHVVGWFLGGWVGWWVAVVGWLGGWVVMPAFYLPDS